MRPLTPIAYCYAAALGVAGAILLLGGLHLSDPIFLGFILLGFLPAPILVHWAFQLEDQYEWLSKGHAKERATEIVAPPRQFRPFVKKLETDLAHAGPMLMAFERSWQRKSFMGQWYGLMLAAFGAVICVSSLFFLAKLPTIIVPHMPIKTSAILAILILAIAFAAAAYLACAMLTKAADTNAEKLAHYLEQKTEKKIHITPLHPTALVPAIGIVAVVLLVPVTFLHSNFEAQKAVQQKAVEETQQVAETLEKRLDETLEKKDFFATENAELLSANQDLNTKVAKAKEVEKLLRVEVDQLKEQVKQLVERNDEATKTIADKTKDLEAKAASIASLTKEKSAIITAKDKLAKELATLKDTSAQKAKDLSASITAKDSQIAELEAKIKELKTAQKSMGPAPIDVSKEMLPALAELSDDKHSITMPTDAFFTAQTDTEEAYFMNNVKTLWNVLDAKVQKADGYALKIYAYADALPPIAHSNNMALTAAQAAKLANAFITQGAPANKVVAVPMGNNYDIDSRLEEDALEANRRIVFMIQPAGLPAHTPAAEPTQN